MGTPRQTTELQLARLKAALDQHTAKLTAAGKTEADFENDSKWRDFINFSLIEMWEDGTYKAIHKKLLGVDPDPDLRIFPWKL